MRWSRLIFLSSILCTASASSHVFIAETPNQSLTSLEPRLTASLLDGQIYQPDVYSKAISFLDTMETSPSCERVAILTLINDCQSLKSSTSSEIELSEVQSEYAIRLAMCEITRAKGKVSTYCADFISRPCPASDSTGFFQRPKKMREAVSDKICYPEVTGKQIGQCLKALSDTSQWWTSFSNNKQNVRSVCQASRHAIEKDEILEQYKQAAVVGNDVTQTVAEAVKQSKDFISSLQNLQAQVLQDWEAEAENSRSALGSLVLNVQTAVHNMIESFRQDAEDASSNMDKLKQDIEKSHETTNNTALVIRSFYESARTRFGEMSAAQSEAWERVGLRADEISSTLATVNADLPDVLNVLQTILEHFQQSSENLSTLHTELEAKIVKNNDNLILQEHIIKQLVTTGGFDGIQSIIMAGAAIVILKSINTWAAISVLATLIMWLIYRALCAIPFIHLAPVKLAFPSYTDLAHDLSGKVIMLFAGVVGVCAAVALVLRQIRIGRESRDRKNTLPQAMTGPPALPPRPQTVAPHILLRDIKTVRPFPPRPRPDQRRARNIRAESAPP